MQWKHFHQAILKTLGWDSYTTAQVNKLIMFNAAVKQ